MNKTLKYYNKVKNDKEIIELYKKIHEYEDLNDGWAYHDFSHVMNVVDCCEKILTELGYDDEIINETKIAAILHDTGCLQGKENHTYRSYEYAKEYFKRKKIVLKNQDLVLEGIKNHSEGFDTDNIIQIALVLADKLDVKKNRIGAAGKKVIGNRQYQYVNEIKLEIKNKKLNIYFECDKKLDLEELNGYYFTAKIFRAVQAFSRKMNITPNMYINNQKWEYFYLNQ